MHALKQRPRLMQYHTRADATHVLVCRQLSDLPRRLHAHERRASCVQQRVDDGGVLSLVSRTRILPHQHPARHQPVAELSRAHEARARAAHHLAAATHECTALDKAGIRGAGDGIHIHVGCLRITAGRSGVRVEVVGLGLFRYWRWRRCLGLSHRRTTVSRLHDASWERRDPLVVNFRQWRQPGVWQRRCARSRAVCREVDCVVQSKCRAEARRQAGAIMSGWRAGRTTLDRPTLVYIDGSGVSLA